MTTDQLDLIAIAASTEHQQILRDAAHTLISRNWSLDEARSKMDADQPLWSPDLWKSSVEAGWNDLMVPSPVGDGGAVGDLCILSGEIGTYLAPIPLASSASASWYLEQPQGAGPTILIDENPVGTVVVGGQCTLTCSWPLVPYGMVARRLLIAVDVAGVLCVATVEGDAVGVTRVPVRPLDRSPSAAVELEQVVVHPIPVPLCADTGMPSRWSNAVNRLRLGIASELTGAAAAANGAAVEYARERITFGRPIGANQSIKHRLVNDRSTIEISRALISRAAVDLEDATVDAAFYVSLAAFWAIDTMRSVPESAIQVFGGIGYTWEHHAHLYLRRAAVLAALLGPIAYHRDVVAAWLRDGSTF